MSFVRRSAGGFTLLEVLAVVLLTGVVLTVAINFYLNLSKASLAAMDGSQRARRAAVLLDRVARDLEATVLVKKPAELDPLAHPWLFLAEGDATDAGAERLKFVSRGRHPRSPTAPESDLEVVVWTAERGAHQDLELRRWSSPALPPGLDRSFPTPDETDLVAAGVAEFGVRLMSEKGEWVTTWDSSSLEASGDLPVAAEIRISFYLGDTNARDGPYVRRVLLPLRPLDLEKLLAVNGPGGPGQSTTNGQDSKDQTDNGGGSPTQQASQDRNNCVTVAACLARHPEINPAAFGPEIQAVVNGSMGSCASDFAATGMAPADCLQ
jgi:type II secretory pathway component PulJ